MSSRSRATGARSPPAALIEQIERGLADEFGLGRHLPRRRAPRLPPRAATARAGHGRSACAAAGSSRIVVSVFTPGVGHAPTRPSGCIGLEPGSSAPSSGTSASVAGRGWLRPIISAPAGAGSANARRTEPVSPRAASRSETADGRASRCARAVPALAGSSGASSRLIARSTNRRTWSGPPSSARQRCHSGPPPRV